MYFCLAYKSQNQILIRDATNFKKLNIPTFAMVDTNSDPRLVDFAIPSNDDASDSIDKILTFICDAIKDGLKERQGMKDKKVEKPAKEASKETSKEEVAEATEEKTVTE